MPYSIKKITTGKYRGKYKVYNRKTKRLHSRHTTKTKAKKQVRLLEGIKHKTIKRKSKHHASRFYLVKGFED